MKQKLFKLMLVLVAIAGIFSLESCDDNVQELVGAKKPLDQKVKYKLAMGCVDLYKSTPLGRIKKKTTEVVFDKVLLKRWIDSLAITTTYDKMEIRFGIYTPEILANRTDAQDKIDKLTVFLFPTLKGKPAEKRSKKDDEEKEIEPYNMGEVHP